jgi:hypothetical protein
MQELRYIPNILNLGTSFTPRERALRYPLGRRLGGPHSQSISYEEKTILLHLLGIKPRFLSRTARSLFAIPTELSQLLLS